MPILETEGSDVKVYPVGKYLLLGVVGFVVILFLKDSFTSHPKPEAVHNSQYDNSVLQVELYLKKNLKDPDSYQSIEWSAVQKVDAPQWKYIVRHKYRAKNSLGGYIVGNYNFYLDEQGKVVSSKKIE